MTKYNTNRVLHEKEKRTYTKGSKLDDDIINLIKDHIRKGNSQSYIAKILMLNRKTVAKYEKEGIEVNKRGRPKENENEEVINTILTNIDDDNTLIMRELQEIVFNEHQLWIDTSAIRKILVSKGYTRKRCSVLNNKRSEQYVIDKRRLFQNWVINQDISRMVFVDEVHLNVKDSNRKYGYSLKGNKAINKNNAISNSSHTLISAIDYNGKGYYSLANHSNRTATNSSSFFEYMNNLIFTLPLNSLIILDNARIHTTDELKTLYRNAKILKNIEIAFLPPYSPSFNPIELMFNSLKAKLRNYNKICNKMNHHEFGTFVLKVVSEFQTLEIRKYFECAEKKWKTEEP